MRFAEFTEPMGERLRAGMGSKMEGRHVATNQAECLLRKASQSMRDDSLHFRKRQAVLRKPP